MNNFMHNIEKISTAFEQEAEELMDAYTEEVFSWYGSWSSNTKEETIDEFKSFYDKMRWQYPDCLRK